MITGRFGRTTGRPYLEGVIHLPRFRITGPISFIVDTGADKTLLTPLDGTRLGLDYTLLKCPRDIGGIGGSLTTYEERAVITFLDYDAKQLHSYDLTLSIAKSVPNIGDIPSLLGRDILDRWSMQYDKPDLTFTVKSSDLTTPLPS